MIISYLKLAWRNLLKHKTDSIINVAGLCVAFACAMLLFLSVYFEFSFDRFHRNAGNIYHVYFNVSRPEGAEAATAMPVPLVPAIKQEFADVQYATRYVNSGTVVRYGDKKKPENLKFADPDFLKMFSFPVLKGNTETALADQNSIVMAAHTAKAIFGNDDPIGKTIELQIGEAWRPFEVTALIQDHPDNSSIEYDLIIRFENLPEYTEDLARWDNFNHDVYIQLRNGVRPSVFETKTHSFITKNFSEDITSLKRDGAPAFADGSHMQLKLLPLKDMHTTTTITGEGGAINRSYLYLLLTIGVLILVIACINFINLGIGRSFTRTHEIGLRKTLGAQRFQLIIQFWTEAFLICLFALIISVLLCNWLLPKYSLLFGMNITKDILYAPLTWAAIAGVFFFVTLAAGGYPAWLMSRFNIIQILKGKISIRRSRHLRNSLTVVQFSIAILLMICTVVAWQQINYLKTKPLGYNKEQVISIPVRGEVNPVAALTLMRTKLAAYRQIESVSGIYDNLGRGLDGSSRRSVMGFDYKDKGVSTVWMGVSYDFVKTLDLKLVAGRDFSEKMLTDSNAVVINEAMAEALGEKNAIGTLLPVREGQAPKQVIGIVANFNFESLHGKVKPLTLVLESRFEPNYILVKAKNDNLRGTMDQLRDVWKTVAPGDAFAASFLDENVDRQYRREEKLGKIFVYGSVVSIVLSCMGLLAMVILLIAQRVKEIGIRKVLGASVASIVVILSKDLVVLIFIALLIASPLAWYFMNEWLQDFAYRIDIRWWVFALAALAALLITAITICLQTLRAALTNPVKSLRSE